MSPPEATVPAQVVRWHPLPDAAALAQAACERILAAAAQAIAARDRFDIVLAGGNTPRAAHALLRDVGTHDAGTHEANIDWSRWQVWFGDERCAPVDDPQRNSAMARAAWLDHVPIPSSNLHSIPTERGAATAAADYANALHDIGDFDLVLLGLGEDGHTASLFPGTVEGLREDAADAVAVFNAPKPPPQRVSMSAVRLSRAREVLFLVEGSAKHDAVRRWRVGSDIPAATIRPAAGVDVLIEAGLLG